MLTVLPRFEEGFEKALDWYREVTSRDTHVIVTEDDSIRDLRLSTLESLNLDPATAPQKYADRLYLGTSRELAWFDDETLSAALALSLFDPDQEVWAFILLNNQAGEMFHGVDKDLRYFINSKEQGHNQPHVHITYRNQDRASISIINCSVLAGNLPNRALKVATARIEENRAYLLKYWNNHTNGVHFDINYLINGVS